MNKIQTYTVAAIVALIFFLVIKGEVKAARKVKANKVVIEVEESELSKPSYFYRNLAIRANNAFEPFFEMNYKEKELIIDELNSLSDPEFLYFIDQFTKVSPKKTFREYMLDEWFPASVEFTDKKQKIIDRINTYSLP